MAISQNFPSVRPSLDLNFAGTKKLDSRITFTRGSVGTYYDSTGIIQTAAPHVARFDHDPSTGESLGLLVEEARTNSLTYSQPDVSGWTANEITYQTNAGLAPDGTWTAALLVPSATNTAGHYLAKSTTNAANTWAVSFHAKAAGYNYAGFTLASQPDAVLVVDLTNGTAIAVGSVVSNVTITALTNGWYRITGTVTTNISRTLRIYPMNTGVWNTSFSGNGTSGIYVWGAQLEVGSFPTSYIPTPATFTSRASSATYYDASGIVQTAGTNVARSAAFFPDSNGVMRSAGLLLEAAGTNLFTYSEQFDNAAWTKGNATITANATAAPDGATTADKIVETTATGEHYAQVSVSEGNRSFSVFAKAAERSWMVLYIYSTTYGDNRTAYFDLANGVIGTVSAGITASMQKLANGWYRVSIYTATGSFPSAIIGVASGNGTKSYAGNASSGLFIWGAQIEDSPYPTSYIQTVASTVTRSADVSSSATVTRSADVASITGTNFSSWFNANQFSVFVNYSCKPSGWYVPLIAFKSSQYNGLIIQGYTGNSWNPYLTGLGNGYFSTTGGGPFSGTQKISFSTTTGSFEFIQNGSVTGAGSTNVTGSYSSVNSLLIFNDNSTSQQLYNTGTIRRLTYWPTRLPDNILQQITR